MTNIQTYSPLFFLIYLVVAFILALIIFFKWENKGEKILDWLPFTLIWPLAIPILILVSPVILAFLVWWAVYEIKERSKRN